MRSYADPQPGVWEIEVEARRTSPLLDNPFKLDVTVLGAAFDPETVTLPEAKVGTPAAVSWKVTNHYAALDGKLAGGPLGSSKTARPTITEGDTQTTTVEVPEGANVARRLHRQRLRRGRRPRPGRLRRGRHRGRQLRRR